jgi:hypothetical protein
MPYVPVGPWADQTDPTVAPNGPAITAANLDHIEAGIVAAHQAVENVSGLTPRGDWSATVQYDTGDLVSHASANWIAQVPSYGSEPAALNGDWQQLEVAAGDWVATDDPRLSDARTPTAHVHPISNVTGLQTALDGKQPSGDYLEAGDPGLTPDPATATAGDGLVVNNSGAFLFAGTWAIRTQTAPGATVAARPAVPDGKVLWELWDKPGTAGAPTDIQPHDKVLDLSGAWAVS